MMIKFLLLPLILVGCTAPVTDPPAHALEAEGGIEKWYAIVHQLQNYQREENKTNPVWLNRAASRMDSKECSDVPLFPSPKFRSKWC